jgi:transposase
MSDRKTRAPPARPRQPRRPPNPGAPSVTPDDLQRAARLAALERRQAEDRARIAALPVQHAHAAGIDAGDASHWVCVEATPDGSDPVREFPAHTAGLRQLVGWLHLCGVTTVALEATGAYGQVLFLTLLEAGFQVSLTPPQFARQIKGRPKTDRRDCQWIQRLHKLGLLPSVFQPDEATQALRDYKPHDPGFDVRTALYYATGVDLTAIEGIDELHALTLVSELGTDFSKWPTVKQFTSWLGLCPNGKKTGGKVQSGRTRHGKGRAARALRLAARCLMRSKSYLGAYWRRQRSRLGAPKAITAAAHTLARIVYNLMRYGVAYTQQTETAYAEQVRQRLEKHLRRRARELGFELKPIESPAVPAVEN